MPSKRARAATNAADMLLTHPARVNYLVAEINGWQANVCARWLEAFSERGRGKTSARRDADEPVDGIE
ncbi:MAG: hypothetical protein DMF64_16080 [Acidobacteria bacterium]|nr:MAG: hypothetical protein DMF64_16080 [Acidobacteriota bacterium]